MLRLLVLEGGVPAPICSDIREDWVRTPITEADLRARMATLTAKAEAHRLPQIDPFGILRFSDRSTSVSPTETDLMECLIRHFESLVSREQLRECLPERASGCSRNALDLHIMRLRRRIQPLGLAIQTVRGRGYILQVAPNGSVAQAWTARPRPLRAEVDSGVKPQARQTTDGSTNKTGAEVTQLHWPQTHRTAAG